MIPQGRVIGLDLGSRRIGVAVTDAGQTLATPAVTINRASSREADHLAIAELVEEYGAVGLVVGLPISLSGDIGPAALAVLQEVEELRSAMAVEVETVDERLTTVAAAGSMRGAGLGARRHRQVIDQVAAAELLQTWVERRKASIT
jgi:putative Holliday junction resolvase